MALYFVWVHPLGFLVSYSPLVATPKRAAVRVDTPGHAQAVVTLITDNGATGFRSEDAVEFSR